MYRVALNVAISFRRREGRRVQAIALPDEHLLSTPAGAEQPDAVRSIYEFIEQQDALDRAILLLYLDGYRYREVGEIVGITETNVATKIGRLKQRLHAYLTKSENERTTEEYGTR